MLKVKHERTADCVVAGFRWHKSGGVIGSMLLGLYDDAGDAAPCRRDGRLPDGPAQGAGRHAGALPGERPREPPLAGLGQRHGRGRRPHARRPEPVERREGPVVGAGAPRAGGRGRATTTSRATGSATARPSSASATTGTRSRAPTPSSRRPPPAELAQIFGRQARRSRAGVSRPTVRPGRLADLPDGQQHAGHERRAVVGVVPDRERLAGGAEQHLLVGHQAPEADGVDADPGRAPRRPGRPRARASRSGRAPTPPRPRPSARRSAWPCPTGRRSCCRGGAR